MYDGDSESEYVFYRANGCLRVKFNENFNGTRNFGFTDLENPYEGIPSSILSPVQQRQKETLEWLQSKRRCYRARAQSEHEELQRKRPASPLHNQRGPSMNKAIIHVIQNPISIHNLQLFDMISLAHEAGKKTPVSFIYKDESGARQGSTVTFLSVEPRDDAGNCSVAIEQGFYKNDKKDGLWITHDPDGSLGTAIIYENGLSTTKFERVLNQIKCEDMALNILSLGLREKTRRTADWKNFEQFEAARKRCGVKNALQL